MRKRGITGTRDDGIGGEKGKEEKSGKKRRAENKERRGETKTEKELD